MEISREIKRIRKTNRISRKKLAHILDIKISDVFKLENDLLIPDEKTKNILVNRFNIDLDKFLLIDNKMIIKKNKTIFVYKFIVLVIIFLYIISALLGIIIINKKRTQSHVIYDNIPIVKLNGIESNYYKISSKWEKKGNDYIYKSYPVTLPDAYIIANIILVEDNANNKIEFDLPCSCRISYFDLDDSLEIKWENKGWLIANNKTIEFTNEDSNTIDFCSLNVNNSILLSVSCDFKDLHVIYYYVIKE